MGFRFRKRLKLFPGITLNFSNEGLSSLSIGPRRATVNIPLGRRCGTRTTVGLPGTGLSWTDEKSKPRSIRERQHAQRQSPTLPSTEETIQEVLAFLVGPNRPGDALWRQGLLQRVLDYDNAPRSIREAAYLIRSPEAVELHMRRARTGAATRKASLEIIRAVQTVVVWTTEQGWSQKGDG